MAFHSVVRGARFPLRFFFSIDQWFNPKPCARDVGTYGVRERPVSTASSLRLNPFTCPDSVARKLADAFLQLLPEDGVPYW
jgi:hypothetical protein